MKLLLLGILFSSLCLAQEDIEFPLDLSQNSPLFVAIAQGQFKEARSLLKNKEQLNKTNAKGATLFHALSLTDNEQGSIHFLSTLLRYITDINTKDEDGNTGFTFAIIKGRYQLAQEFLRYEKTDIYVRNSQGKSILYLFSDIDLTNPHAAQTLNTTLSKAGVLIRARDKSGNTILHYTVTPGHENIAFLKILLSTPEANVNLKTKSTGDVPILIPLIYLSQKLKEALSKTDISAYTQKIHKAIEVIEVLLSSPYIDLKVKNNQGISPDSLLSTLKEDLQKISKNSSLYPIFQSIMQTLSIKPKESDSLFKAIAQGDFQKTRKLLKDGEKPNQKNTKGETVFNALITIENEQESIELLHTFLEYGLDINIQDKDGNTGLFLAIIKGRYQLAYEILQNKKTDIYQSNNKGERLLHIFAQADLTNPDANQLLDTILSQAETHILINSKDKKRYTPLHLAVGYSNTELVKILVSRSETSINEVDSFGYVPISTPLISLHYVIKKILQSKDGYTYNMKKISKTIQVIQILFNSPHNLELTVKNDQDQSPYDELLFIQENLPKIPQDSDFYFIFEPIRELLESKKEFLLAIEEETQQKKQQEETNKQSEGLLKNTDDLVLAIARGDFQKAENLLKEGVNPNQQSQTGSTALSALTSYHNEQRSIQFLQVLLDYGADINRKNKNGDTALALAIWRGRYKLAQAFLQEKYINIYTRNEVGFSILHYFVFSDFTNPDAIQTFNKLLSQGATSLINLKDINGQTPLHLATSYKNIEFMNALLSQPETYINTEDNDGNVSILEPLLFVVEQLYYSLHPTKERRYYGLPSPQLQNSHSQHIYKSNQAIQTLLKYKVNLKIKNNDDISPDDQLSILKEDLPKLSKDSPYYSVFEPLRHALALLIKEHYPLNSPKNTPLFLAIAQGDFQQAKQILQSGRYLNKKNVKGASVFHALAIHDNERESVEFLPTLLEYGADINTQDNDGNTGLVFAIIKGRYQLAQTFIQNSRINIEIKNKEGLNILHFFSRADLINPYARQALNMVLSQVELINTGNLIGQTPLHYAVQPDNINMEFLKIVLPRPETYVNTPDDSGSVPILEPILYIAESLNSILLEENFIPDFQKIRQSSQAVQIFWRLHNVDLNIKNNQGNSPYSVLRTIKENLLKLPKSSRISLAFEPLEDILTSIN